MKANRRELAEIFGVTLPTIDSWRRAGMPFLRAPSRDRAAPLEARQWQFETADCIRWHLSRSRSRIATKPPADPLAALRALTPEQWDELARGLAGSDEAPAADPLDGVGLDADELDELLNTPIEIPELSAEEWERFCAGIAALELPET